ncbi:MAG TPA: metalloregulator ArsR/SmtB family transcription factor [Burkholderiales bacterium]|nr:metalloregulator ArsR/SmtB family transcription factor [Burkholderiales bacterium]
MNATTPAQMVAWLKAAGEPTRFRLLALCIEGSMSVSDLAQALRQSEPRVSRHLKILCAAGLLARTREGQWVRYGPVDDGNAISFIQGLLLHVDRRDPLLLRDRARAREAVAVDARGALSGSQPRLDRALSAFVEASGFESAPGQALVVGVVHLELLGRVAESAGACTVIAHSRRGAQAARAFAERRGFTCRVLTVAPGGELGTAELTRSGGPYDAVLLDHQSGGELELAQLLARVRPLVAANGRLWIFQRYDSLESSRGRVVEHPLAQLRRLLDAANFVCERLSPIEADGEHLLAAAARLAGAASGAGGDVARTGSGR